MMWLLHFERSKVGGLIALSLLDDFAKENN
jgi:hypothetical protein